MFFIKKNRQQNEGVNNNPPKSKNNDVLKYRIAGAAISALLLAVDVTGFSLAGHYGGDIAIGLGIGTAALMFVSAFAVNRVFEMRRMNHYGVAVVMMIATP